MSLAQLKAMGADRGVVPVAFEIGGQILTKPVRAHADGRVDLLDIAANMYSKRSAARMAMNRLLYDEGSIRYNDQNEPCLIGFPRSAFSKVRWAGETGAHDSIVALPNVAVHMLLALRSRGGDELRAALATQLVRAMQAKAGLSDEEIHALEQPTPKPAAHQRRWVSS